MQMSLRENLQTTPMQTMSASIAIIRTMPNNKKANIPIIAMTANAFEEDRRNAFAAGMDGHISKPIDVQVLLETLNKIFR